MNCSSVQPLASLIFLLEEKLRASRQRPSQELAQRPQALRVSFSSVLALSSTNSTNSSSSSNSSSSEPRASQHTRMRGFAAIGVT
ncbi:hypothetical protein ACSSS7_008448 [Eimeria intestinalis]